MSQIVLGTETCYEAGPVRLGSMARLEDLRVFMRQAYPAYAEAVDRGLDEDPVFRDLCEDFQRCAKALEANRRSHGARWTERVAEYEHLLGELAEDVESWLAASSARSRNARDQP